MICTLSSISSWICGTGTFTTCSSSSSWHAKKVQSAAKRAARHPLCPQGQSWRQQPPPKRHGSIVIEREAEKLRANSSAERRDHNSTKTSSSRFLAYSHSLSLSLTLSLSHSLTHSRTHTLSLSYSLSLSVSHSLCYSLSFSFFSLSLTLFPFRSLSLSLTLSLSLILSFLASWISPGRSAGEVFEMTSRMRATSTLRKPGPRERLSDIRQT